MEQQAPINNSLLSKHNFKHLTGVGTAAEEEVGTEVVAVDVVLLIPLITC